MVATLQHSVDSSTLLTPDLSTNQQLFDLLTLAPGQIAGLSGIPGSGLTRIGMSLLAPYASRGPIVYLDVRGWASPTALWEMGIEPEHLVVVRSSDIVSWAASLRHFLMVSAVCTRRCPRGCLISRCTNSRPRHAQNEPHWCSARSQAGFPQGWRISTLKPVKCCGRAPMLATAI